MGAFRIFSRFAELLDVKVARAANAWLRLNTDGSVSQRTAAQTRSDIGAAEADHNHSELTTIKRIALVGDSITETSGTNNYIYMGWGHFMRLALESRVELVYNTVDSKWDFGVAGAHVHNFLVTGESCRARFLAALQSNADTIAICLGANDCVAESSASIIEDLIALWDEVENAGKRVVAMAIPSCASTHAVAATYKGTQQAVNASLAATAASRGILFVDWQDECDLDSDGYSDAAYMYDTIHPNATGYATYGHYAATKIDPFTPQNKRIDAIPAKDSTRWLTANPHAQGTLGANQAPAGWAVSAVNNSSVTKALVARSDDLGNWLELVTSGGVNMKILNPSDYTQIYLNPTVNVVAGTVVRFVAEYDIVSGEFWGMKFQGTQGANTYGYLALNGSGGKSLSDLTVPFLETGPGIFLSQPFTIPTTGSYTFSFINWIVGNGTIRIGRLGLYTEIPDETLPIALGGTGATTAALALTALGALPANDASVTNERVPTDAGLTSKFSTNKATIVDGDKVGIFDSEATPTANIPKHTLWSLVKSTLKTYFDGIYALTGHTHSVVAEIGIACSDETTALAAGTAKATFRMPYAMTVTAVRASVTTAATGATLLTVDINEGGTSILSTKLTIDASEKTSTTAATAAVITDANLASDAEITIDIDSVGSTIAGAGLKVWLIGTRA